MGKSTQVIHVLKSVQKQYEFDSDEYQALNVAIKSITKWGDLNAEINNCTIWGFEDVPQRFQVASAIKAKVLALIHKALKEMGLR